MTSLVRTSLLKVTLDSRFCSLVSMLAAAPREAELGRVAEAGASGGRAWNLFTSSGRSQWKTSFMFENNFHGSMFAKTIQGVIKKSQLTGS